MLPETVIGLPHPRLHPRLKMPVAVLDRFVLQPARDRRFAVLLHIAHGHQVVMPRHRLPALGVDGALGCRDFAVHARPPVFAAGVIVPQGVAPGPSRTQVDLADGHRKTPWAPPPLDVLRLGARLPDETARRIDHRSDDQLTIRRRVQRDNGLTLDGHFAPPCLSAPADTRRVGQYAPPSSRDSGPPSRRRPSTAPRPAGTAAIAPAVPASPAPRGGAL